MIELTEKAENYAAEKTNEAITKAIAQAYTDGYRDGYKDCEEEIPINLRDNKTEYVDLGLPSGTLWSMDYEKVNNERAYIPYEKALEYTIPTIEQCKELFESCKFLLKNGLFFCLGPNGNHITFSQTGFKQIGDEDPLCDMMCFYWIRNDNKNLKNKAQINIFGLNVQTEIFQEFSGCKVPIRLVRTK